MSIERAHVNRNLLDELAILGIKAMAEAVDNQLKDEIIGSKILDLKWEKDTNTAFMWDIIMVIDTPIYPTTLKFRVRAKK